MKIWRLMFIAMMVWPVMACVPTISDYHSVESEVGVVISAPCSPDDAWKIKIQDASLEIYPWGGTMGMMFRLPESYVLEMKSREMKLWINSEEIPHFLPINKFEVINSDTSVRGSIKSWEPLVGNTAKIWGFDTYRIFNSTLNSPLNLNDIDQFKIEVPRFNLNGSDYGGYILHFKKSQKFWLVPINC